MGGSHSTVSVTEDSLPPLRTVLDSHPLLNGYQVVERFPNRSRLYQSVRVRHGETGVHAVLKVAFIKHPHHHRVLLTNLVRELKQLQQASTTLAHVWAPTFWCNEQGQSETETSSSTSSSSSHHDNNNNSHHGNHAAALPPSTTTTHTSTTSSSVTSPQSTTATTHTSATTTATPPSSTTATVVSSPSSSSTPLTRSPVFWLRPVVYTTLADRFVSRPWLDATEQLWYLHQLLQGLSQLHRANLVHGSLSTSNVGLTSTNWLVLLDHTPASARPRRYPTNDPTEYLYCVSPQNRCYLAPERLQPPHLLATEASAPAVLTPAMDVFSLGCILVELFLNGEACWDSLGQLLEYKNTASTIDEETPPLPSFLQQRLQKIALSRVRAAARHMLRVHPDQRLSVHEYQQRLLQHGGTTAGEAAVGTTTTSSNTATTTAVIPPVLSETLYPLVARMHVRPGDGPDDPPLWTPDARFFHLYQAYPKVLFETTGYTLTKHDLHGPHPWTITQEASAQLPLPSAAPTQLAQSYHSTSTSSSSADAPPTTIANDNPESPFLQQQQPETVEDPLWKETMALLQQLDAQMESLQATSGTTASSPQTSAGATFGGATAANGTPPASSTTAIPKQSRTAMEESCLVIYVQQILTLLRHVQRPATRLKALLFVQDYLLPYVSDEVRLQRILPVLVDLFKDVDPLVRSHAIASVAQLLEQLASFPPADAQVLPKYVWKRLQPLLTDPSALVRASLAQHLGALAVTAQRFLEISHAVQLVQHESSHHHHHGGNGSGHNTTCMDGSSVRGNDPQVFAEEVTQLLDPKQQQSKQQRDAAASTTTGPNSKAVCKPGQRLITTTYANDRSHLVDTISRWVVHLCTDPSQPSWTKRALCQPDNCAKLCHFLGYQGVLQFLLPQCLVFFNERQDWLLRRALFEALPVMCQIIGKSATEKYVLPCMEIGWVDPHESVVAQALLCLQALLERGLLSRALLVAGGGTIVAGATVTSTTILDRYSAFFVHPSRQIRQAALSTTSTMARQLGSPDALVYLTPLLRPYLRFPPTTQHLENPVELEQCIQPAFSRSAYQELSRQAASDLLRPHSATANTSMSHLDNPGWTQVDRLESSPPASKKENVDEGALKRDPMQEEMLSYLRLLVRNGHYKASSGGEVATTLLQGGIEGSLKLAQSVVFPRQDVAASQQRTSLPDWYRELRESAEEEDKVVTEASAIQSVAALGQVYGLSLVVGPEPSSLGTATAETTTGNQQSQQADEALESASMGYWESEVRLDPDIVDTSLLVTKLRALRVPTLPPFLSGPVIARSNASPPVASSRLRGKETSGSPSSGAATVGSGDSKNRMKSLVASSSTITGHRAPVVRLAVSLDGSFFVSASHDGTCAVWEVPQLEHSSGVLEKSTVYQGHFPAAGPPPRINDVAMVEGTYSVVSGASNGSVHVWRVDMVSSSNKVTSAGSPSGVERRSRVVGASSIQEIDPKEGEILAVSHFTSLSNSVVVYATQKGVVRTWDLRSSKEPFNLPHGPSFGHLSAMALGGDRNWLVTGTSRGYMALWDVRFQQAVKLWRHSRSQKIHRVATSFLPPPSSWGKSGYVGSSRPFLFVGTSANECGMFDVLTGNCVECFRTIPIDVEARHLTEEVPTLVDISSQSRFQNNVLSFRGDTVNLPSRNFSPSINCMVGSIGGQSNSYLLTGGSDGCIRSWDFSMPSRCQVLSGVSESQPRPNFERIDMDGGRKRLIVCRQHSSYARPFQHQGLKKPEYYHTDSIQDLKIVDSNALLSCSRDCTIRVWR